MSTVHTDGVAAAEEGPLLVRDVDLWSENYCWTAWDQERGIGLWLHMGRTPSEPSLWHEMIALHLPGDRILVGKNYSRGETPEGPAGSMLNLTCERPFERWSIEYDGLTRELTKAGLAAGGVPDGPERRVQLRLTFESAQPVWSFGAKNMEHHLWSKGHYEQLGTYSGTLITGGAETPLQLLGWRDHSHGPRDISSFVSHTLVTAQFEDGRSLLAVEIIDEDPARSFRKARIVDGDAIDDDVEPKLPVVDDQHDPSPSYEFELMTASGPLKARAEQLCRLPMTMQPPNDMIHGRAYGPGAYTLWMGQARVVLDDGTVGYGHLERAGRIGESA